MAKYYLYLLVSIFLFINGIEYFEDEIEKTVKKRSLLEYKLKKQNLYALHIDEVEAILNREEKILSKNRLKFFDKNQKETIVFSEIQNYLQGISKKVNGKIKLLNSGILIDNKLYRKYPIMLNLTLIPEDLDKFFKELYKTKKYLFIDSIQISVNKRELSLYLKITLMGYQIK